MTQAVEVRLRRLAHAHGLEMPVYQSAGAAGADLRAALDEPITLAPMERRAVPTGFAAEIPEGYEIQLRPRSGLAARHGVTLLNTPGTVDSDYRGEIHVVLINLGAEPFVVSRGERIAQIVVAPVVQAVFREAEGLSQTERGAGGFGSTGR